MVVHAARKKRPLSHKLIIFFLTPILIATNLLGTVPDNPFSTGMRQYMALMLPAEFAGWLNRELTGFSLPTLPPVSASAADLSASPSAVTLIPRTSTITLTPTLTLTPTVTFTPTLTSTPTVTPTPTLIPNPAGIWTFNWEHPDFNTVWPDTFRIVQRGDGFVVTFISDLYLGDLQILSQSWDGTSLDFTYRNEAIYTTVHIKTLGIDANGQLWVSVLSPWVGPPTTALPPAK